MASQTRVFGFDFQFFIVLFYRYLRQFMSKLIKQDDNLAKGGDSLKRLSTRISSFFATRAVNEFSVVEPLANNLSSSQGAKCVCVCVCVCVIRA